MDEKISTYNTAFRLLHPPTRYILNCKLKIKKITWNRENLTFCVLSFGSVWKHLNKQ